MNLHRTRAWWLQLSFVVATAAALSWLLISLVAPAADRMRPYPLVRGWVAFALGLGAFLYYAGKTLTQIRFRFSIDAHGLVMRTPGTVATVRWEEIDSIILDDLRLLVVPALGYRPDPYPGLKRLGSTAPDGRLCQEVLALNQVRESPEQIAAALSRHAGSRFVNATLSTALTARGRGA